MKSCELCQAPAKTYCESDQANLCWRCDTRVHAANFIVARHSRNLLCRACHSLTPWRASGSKLGLTISMCESCSLRAKDKKAADEESERVTDYEIEAENEENDDDDVDFSRDGDEEAEGGADSEDGEYQVVPWSSTPPPPHASSSSSEESMSRFNAEKGDISQSVTTFSLKRVRNSSSNLRSEEDPWRSSSHRKFRSELAAQTSRSGGDGDAISVDSERPLKDRRTEPDRSPPTSYR